MRQVRVVRGRTGRLGAIPFGAQLDGTPHVIADYDAAGDVVGIHLEAISAATLGLADEFLDLLDMSLPAGLASAIRA